MDIFLKEAEGLMERNTISIDKLWYKKLFRNFNEKEIEGADQYRIPGLRKCFHVGGYFVEHFKFNNIFRRLDFHSYF